MVDSSIPSDSRIKNLRVNASEILDKSITRNLVVTNNLETNSIITSGAQFLTLPAIQLQTVGGTPSDLDYYENVSLPCTFSGPWATSQASFLHFVRVGKNVTMTIESAKAVATTSSQINCSITVPARFFPKTSSVNFATNYVVSVVSGNIFDAGLLQVNSLGGLLVIYATTAKGLFPIAAVGLSGFDQIDVSWTTA